MTAQGPIRLGMVGIGRAIWGMHCPELESKKDKFEIVAACDTIKARRAQMMERYNCPTYRWVKDLVEDPNVEIVDIATRSRHHFQHAKLALEAGKDVLVEKPMCVSYSEARRLFEIAEKCGKRLFVRHNRRFEPAFQHIREIIDSGLLGDVREIKLRRVGFGRRDDWQTLKSSGGGQLLNWGPHIIDHGLQLLGAPLKSQWSDLKLIAALGDAEDHLKIVLRGENDRIVDIEISGGAVIGEPEYLVWGSRGGLSCTGDKITMKYLDPKIPLEDRTADPGTPGTTFGTPEKLNWLDETFPAKPKLAVDMNSIWDYIYHSYREGAPFPITTEECLGVMSVVSTAKKGTRF